jgi:hypothetical protein
MRITHYTVDTGHTSIHAVRMDRRTKILMFAFLKLVVVEQSATFNLPIPELNDYYVKVTYTPEGVAFDVLDKKKVMMTTNFLCLKEEHDLFCWEAFESMYLRVAATLELPGYLQVSRKPKKVPWLATMTVPNPSILECPWLAGFEQIVAASLIDFQES